VEVDQNKLAFEASVVNYVFISHLRLNCPSPMS